MEIAFDATTQGFHARHALSTPVFSAIKRRLIGSESYAWLLHLSMSPLRL